MHKQRLKEMRVVVGIVALLAFVLACNISSFAAENRVLQVMDWKLNETGATQVWFQHVKEVFEESHPGVTVEYIPQGWGEAYKEKIITASAGGVAPDVVSLSIIWANDLYQQGLLMPLNSYLKSDPEVAPDKMVPATQVYNQWQGQVFGITHTMDENVLFYDIDAFQAAGLNSDPYAIKNWDQFSQYAKKLTRRSNDGQVTFAGYEPDFWDTAFTSWLTANGGSFYNDILTAANFNTTEGRQTLQFLSDLRNVHRVTGGSVLEGKGAMITGGNWLAYQNAQQNPDLNFGMTSFPQGPSGSQRGTTVWGNMYSIPAQAGNPDLAWEFIRWYTSLEGNLEMVEYLPYLSSPRLDFYQSGAWQKMAGKYSWAARVPEIAYVGGVFDFLDNSAWMQQGFLPYLMKAYQGNMAVGTALEQAEVVMNRLLTQ